MNRLLTLISVFLCTITLSAPIASAHPRKETETTITFNARTGHTEFVHRFRVIDAEAALAEQVGERLDLIKAPAARKAFENYVQQRFVLRGEHGQIPLTMVGSEFAEGSYWVYQEGPPLPRNETLLLRDSMLMEVQMQQVNIIYLEVETPYQTLILTRRSPWEAFRLDGENAY